MPASFKPTLKDKPNEDGRYPVYIQVIKYRVPKKVWTDVVINKKAWNPDGNYEKANWITSADRNYKNYNKALQDLVTEGINLSLNNRHATAEQLQKMLQGKSIEEPAPAPAEDKTQASFLEFFDKEVKRLEAVGNPRTARKRKSILTDLKTYLGDGVDLTFAGLNVTLLRNYEHWLKTKEKPNKAVTISKKMEIIHGILLLGMKEGYRDKREDPFEDLKFSYKKEKKKRLDEEDINLLFENLGSDKFKYWENYALSEFLMQYYCQGARVGDMIELRWEKNITPERVIYTMRKTGVEKHIKRNRFINKILDFHLQRAKKDKDGNPVGFIFPYLKEHEQLHLLPAKSTNPREAAQERLTYFLKRIEEYTAIINRYLKRVAAILEIEVNITSHIARHTFASIAKKKLKGDTAAVQGMLAHDKPDTTENYFAENEIDEFDAAAALVYGE